jgi:hypothetical protein
MCGMNACCLNVAACMLLCCMHCQLELHNCLDLLAGLSAELETGKHLGMLQGRCRAE